jgi:NAD(P)-dependent dehydrogenase (short-subunit alcohol dehydrogenase family)
LALTDEDWDWALTINFLAAVRTTRAALPPPARPGSATIVTVSSVNAFASCIHGGLVIMGFRGVEIRKGAPELGQCGLSRSA